ncbi:MAG: hypothetical protein ACI90V_000486 [Bacillariaceae sp.]|jgi:hypothetical protein
MIQCIDLQYANISPFKGKDYIKTQETGRKICLNHENNLKRIRKTTK